MSMTIFLDVLAYIQAMLKVEDLNSLEFSLI